MQVSLETSLEETALPLLGFFPTSCSGPYLLYTTIITVSKVIICPPYLLDCEFFEVRNYLLF